VLDFRLSKGIMDALPALAAELVRIHHFRQAAVTSIALSAVLSLVIFQSTHRRNLILSSTSGLPVPLGYRRHLILPQLLTR